MHTIALLTSTGAARIDQALRDSIVLIEQLLPDRVRGYYLVGSYAYGEAQPSSDVDLVVVLKDELGQADRQQFVAARAECKRISVVPLDISLESEAKLLRVGGVWFQTASLLVYGEDIRPRIPRKPVANHIRDVMHALVPLLARVRGNPALLTFPLDYPDPAGMVYGYDARYSDSNDPQYTPTKDLVTNVLAAANALTLLTAQRYVGSGKKSDIPRQYTIWIGDQWTTLVEEIVELCRIRWGYRMPEAEADIAHLRGLCQQALGFENAFLQRYRDFLLADLQSDHAAAQLFAVQRFGQILYPDPAVAAAVADLAAHASAELQQAAAATLEHYKQFSSA
jgi:predicted nucleotidyltransferase